MRLRHIVLGASVVSGLALAQAASASVVADWTFYHTAGYSSGLPVDTTGNHSFQNGYGNPNPSNYGGNINPGDTSPSASCSFLNNNNSAGNAGGFYGIATSSTMPTSNFSIDLWVYPTANGGNQTTNSPGIIFSADGDTAGSIDIGVSGGKLVAYIDPGGPPASATFSGTALGSASYSNNTAYELTVTNLNGTTSFYVNNTFEGSSTNAISATPFGNVSVGVQAGDGDYYSGAIEDLTVSTVTGTPEPTSLSLLALAAGGLLVRRRRV
jgi:hypothetical protein